jgi:tetratricopeptide (TPR) repeat protein
LGDRQQEAQVLTALGVLARERQDYDESRRYFDEGEQLLEEHGGPFDMAVLLGRKGELELEQGDIQSAGRVWREALTMWREIGSPGDISSAIDNLARLSLHSGSAQRASRLAAAAASLRKSAGLTVPCMEDALGEKDAAQLHLALDEAAFDTAYREGAALSPDEAVTYALGETTWSELEPVVAERLAAREDEA